MLANSGVKHLILNGKRVNPDRWDELEEAINFFNCFKNAKNIPKRCIENPIPHKYARDGFTNRHGRFIKGIDYYSQIIQPWQFGHGEQKATCLWLINLPKLLPTNIVKGIEQRIWKMAPSPERSKLRSKTFPGIAKAMAEQWG